MASGLSQAISGDAPGNKGPAGSSQGVAQPSAIIMGQGVDRTGNGAQTLLIDADDTLWENNIYFERAIARFISFLNHHEFSPEQVREVLNDVERECIRSEEHTSELQSPCNLVC